MKPFPRYFMVEGKLVKLMYTKGKITAQVISTGGSMPPATVLSKGTEITHKEFVAEKARMLRRPKP